MSHSIRNVYSFIVCLIKILSMLHVLKALLMRTLAEYYIYAGKSFTHKKRCAACFQPSHQRTLSRAAPSFLCLGFALSGGTGMRLLLAALGQPAESENVSIFHVETRIN